MQTKMLTTQATIVSVLALRLGAIGSGGSGFGAGGSGSGGFPVHIHIWHGMTCKISNGQSGGQSGVVHCVKLYTMQGPWG